MMRKELVMPHTVLLLQDNAADAGAFRRALSESSDQFFQIESVSSLNEGLQWLAEKNPVSAIVLDLFLPDSSGIETFDKLLLAARQIPILVLTNSHGEALAKLAVQRGAQDYLLKERLDSYLLPKTLDSMMERAANAEALFEEKERAQVTLNSIGDAVVSTDVDGHVTYLNVVAEAMTGWPLQQAQGLPLETVFRIIDGTTRAVVKNPMKLAIQENKTVGLTPNCILLRRDGSEAAIEDSAAPIHDRQGQVTGAVMVFHDVTTARALTVRLSHLAEHDSLTGLPNRLLLNDRLTQAIVLAERHRQQLAVLFLDIDRFKHINDSMGHAVGDRLLQSVAERLVSCVRSSDTVSRQGGDEFILLLSELSDAQDAAASAEKILLALAEPYCIDDQDLYMTASIGIVAYPEDGADADTLVRNADVAMYRAKNAGRGNYQFFKPEMHARTRASSNAQSAMPRQCHSESRGMRNI
jgi:diguanylate cyclase (GGDEF)-like protein/PAS domain S-box-containing protein